MEVENVCSRVTFTRDFSPGCGNLMSSSSSVKCFYGYSRDFPPGCGPNSPRNLQSLSEKILGGRENGSDNDSDLWRRRPSSASLRSKPPLVPNYGRVLGGLDVRNLNSNLSRLPVGMGGRMMVKNPSKVKFLEEEDSKTCSTRVESKSSEGLSKEREKVVEMLRLFRKRCDELLKRGGVKRVDFEANRELVGEGKIMKQPSLMFGDIPGVGIGDRFYYRMELAIVGLHRLLQGGIDSMEYNGERYATCIVANERHMDKLNDPNVLIYIGEGGNNKGNEVGVPPDQQLVAGNLALNNSRKRKRPVRVIRRLAYGGSRAKIVYVYDGVYEVADVVKKKGPQGNMIFEFQMTRNPGQPAVPWTEYRRMCF